MTLDRSSQTESGRQDPSAAQLRIAIESMADGFMLWDADRRLVAWNERLLEYLPHLRGVLHVGGGLSEILGLAVVAGRPDWSAAQRAQFLDERLAAFGEEEAKLDLAPRDGRVLQLDQRRTADGGVVIVYRDVTQERLASERLAASEARFRDGIESMGQGFVLWGADGRLISWNSLAVEMLPHIKHCFVVGMDREEMMREAAQRAFPGLNAVAREAWMAARREVRLTSTPFEFTTPTGRTIRTQHRAMSGGGYVVIYTDITETRMVLQRLVDSEAEAQRLALVAAHTTSSVSITDALGRIEWVNPAFTRLTGYDIEAVRGRKPGAFLHGPQTQPAKMREMRDALASGSGFNVEIINHHRDGSAYWASVEVTPVRDADGRLTRYIGIQSDISERKRHEAELLRALVAERDMNAEQRRFVAMASHEFRTPLAVIDGAVQRIQARLPEADPEIGKRLQRIRKSVSQLTQLIERTLSNARLDAGRLELQPGSVDLVALLREICNRQRTLTPEFELDLALPAILDPIEGDPRLLEQVFSNLVSNAIKYSGASRRIDLALAERGEAVEFTIRDHGVGIPPMEIPKLFMRFFRASTATGIAGTGIGLHLVKELVTMHGGEVAVDSVLGHGSLFRVVLPRRLPVAHGRDLGSG